MLQFRTWHHVQIACGRAKWESIVWPIIRWHIFSIDFLSIHSTSCSEWISILLMIDQHAARILHQVFFQVVVGIVNAWNVAHNSLAISVTKESCLVEIIWLYPSHIDKRVMPNHLFPFLWSCDPCMKRPILRFIWDFSSATTKDIDSSLSLFCY